MAAAEVTRGALRAIPSGTEPAASPVRSYSSLMRESRNTS